MLEFDLLLIVSTGEVGSVRCCGGIMLEVRVVVYAIGELLLITFIGNVKQVNTCAL